MIIKYKNEKEEWEEIYKYINKQKLNFSKIRVLVLSILSGIALYMVIYTLFDYVYRIIFSCIYSILSCIIGIIVFNKYLYKTIEDTMDIDEKEIIIEKEYIEIKKSGNSIRIKKNSNYKLLDINNKLVLLDGKNIIFIIPNSVFKDIIKKEEFGTRRIDKIKLSDAKAWFIKLQADGRGYSSIHSVRGIVRPAFQMAVEDDLLRKNPFEFQLCTVVVNDSVTRQAITKEQEELFLEFIRNDDHYSKYYNGMFILFKTGLRISEFCGLTVKDIDLQERKSM